MISTYRVRLGQLSLQVRDAGDGPLIVLLHGITANAAVWEPIMAGLRDSSRVIAVDQRGHGGSDKPAHGYTADDFARDLRDLLLHLGQGSAVVVGHSLGARNALCFAAKYPHLARGVVAIDFTPFIARDGYDAVETRIRSGDRAFASMDDVQAYLAARYPLMPRVAVTRRAESGYERGHDGRYRALAQPQAMLEAHRDIVRGDLAAVVRQVLCPILFIRGERSSLVAPSAFEQTRCLAPEAGYLCVEGTDHYVPEEAPGVVADAVGEFATRCWRESGTGPWPLPDVIKP